MVVTFNQGSYELSGAGEKPITVTLAGQRAKLTAAGQTQTLKMPDVVKAPAPQGSAVLACSGERMAIATGQIRLELERA